MPDRDQRGAVDPSERLREALREVVRLRQALSDRDSEIVQEVMREDAVQRLRGASREALRVLEMADPREIQEAADQACYVLRAAVRPKPHVCDYCDRAADYVTTTERACAGHASPQLREAVYEAFSDEATALRERIASLMLDEPSKTAGLYAAIDELQREVGRLRQLARELLQFIPYDKPELGPLPDWIEDIRKRAHEALDA